MRARLTYFKGEEGSRVNKIITRTAAIAGFGLILFALNMVGAGAKQKQTHTKATDIGTAVKAASKEVKTK